MAAGDVMRRRDDVTGSKVLRDVLTDHRQELVHSLDTSTLFLTYLAKHHIIEPADILKYEHYRQKEKRNSELLDRVIDREPMIDNCYSKFIDALKRSEQDHLAAVLTNVDKELEIVNQYQEVLEKNLKEIDSFLHKESRRIELRYRTGSPDAGRQTSPPSAERGETKHELSDLLRKVHHSTKSTIIHLSRCREVIDKLHRDCGLVAKKNGDLLSKLRECDTLIRHTAPAQVAVELEQDRLEVGSVVSWRSDASQFTRSRQNEAAALLDSIRYSVGAIVDESAERRAEEAELADVIQNMINDVKARRLVLDRCTEPPPRDLNRNKYIRAPLDGAGRRTTFKTKLGRPLHNLANELQVYVHQESQITHKQTLSRLQNSSGVTHRNFDQIEHDLMHLDKEVRRGDYAAANTLLKQISEATKVEREDCLRLTEDITRTVRMRRLRLQEMSAGNRLKKRTTSRRRPTRTLDTNFLKKLSEVEREVKLYLDLEMDVMAKHKEEMMKKRLEYEKEMRSRMTELKGLEKKTRDLESEKEKYKKLYVQEKAVKETKLLTKPIIPKRVLTAGGEEVKVDVSYQKPTSRRGFSSTKQYNYVTRQPDVNSIYSRSLSHKGQQASGKLAKSTLRLSQNGDLSPEKSHRGRNTRQGAAVRGHHARGAFVAARPRLTPRAKHWTKPKAAEKDGQQLKQPSSTRFSYTVRNI